MFVLFGIFVFERGKLSVGSVRNERNLGHVRLLKIRYMSSNVANRRYVWFQKRKFSVCMVSKEEIFGMYGFRLGKSEMFGFKCMKLSVILV